MQAYIDLTNTFSVPFVTGIQRVAIELTTMLLSRNDEKQFTPIVYVPTKSSWRTLNRFEKQRLSPRWAKSSQIFKVSRRIMSKLWPKSRPVPATLCPGACFVEIDSAWHSLPERESLLPRLKANHVNVFTIHYDLTPLTHPEVVHPQTREKFMRHFRAHLIEGSVFVCISRYSEATLTKYSKSHFDITPTTQCITLGTDHLLNVEKRVHWPLPKAVKKYLLCVGTVEPRKNHLTLLDVADKLWVRHPDLVLVLAGRRGWLADGIVRRIETHKYYNSRLFWLEGIDDGTLRLLYEKAHALVLPSLNEGLGLPVGEALALGCNVVCSNAGGLGEIGGNHAKYFDPRNAGQIENLLDVCWSEVKCGENKLESFQDFNPKSWANCADELIAVLKIEA